MGYKAGMTNDEELPDFPHQPPDAVDTEVPTAPADPDDKEADTSAPMNSA
jgi:hypothetical protein